MTPEEENEKEQTEQLEELRKTCYNDPDCTAVDGAPIGKTLQLPVGMELSLDIVAGPKEGVKFVLPKGNIIIGRAPEVDLTIDDDKISRKHAIIEAFSRDQIYISDLASTNGTFLNGMRVRSIKMRDGDKLKIGKTVMNFVCREI